MGIKETTKVEPKSVPVSDKLVLLLFNLPESIEEGDIKVSCKDKGIT